MLILKSRKGEVFWISKIHLKAVAPVKKLVWQQLINYRVSAYISGKKVDWRDQHLRLCIVINHLKMQYLMYSKLRDPTPS